MRTPYSYIMYTCKLYMHMCGLLHESYVHERLKSSLGFRWPGMAVVSGRMARADGVYIELERPDLPRAARLRKKSAEVGPREGVILTRGRMLTHRKRRLTLVTRSS